MSPSPFVAEWAARLGPRSNPEARTRKVEWSTPPHEHQPRALDVAMGRGRHAVLLARAGFKTFGVDVRYDAVHDAMRAAAAEGLVVHGWCADLTQTALPAARFDLIVVTRFLQRDLVPGLRAALAPEGVILYETFTVAQRAYGFGPRSPDHLLEPGELRELFDGLELIDYEEVSGPEAVARIVARRRQS